MQTKTNPYALPLSDAKREYQKLCEKPIWYPVDIKRLEDLNRKVNSLKVLVSVWEQSHHASK